MKYIILQGFPGVGKTTLMKKIANKLKEMAIEVSGFYTEELRDSKNYRTGFDVVTLDDKRGVLARRSTSGDSKYKIGSYNVHIDDFEKIALPVFDNIKSILIIDEIGKMELLSKKFESKISQIVTNNNTKLVATVPLKGGAPLILKLKSDSSSRLFTVTTENRDDLFDEIINLVLE